MHSINVFLSKFGIQVIKIPWRVSKNFLKEYNRQFRQLKSSLHRFDIFKSFRYDVGSHPLNYVDYECGFAANHLLQRLNSEKILDIGSYRHFIIGLLSHFKVTTIDVRERKSISENEAVVTCDAKNLELPDNEFDVVVSLCALEHFGLGRYGDKFDLDADKKAFKEMIRVLKPNGRLIYTTTITRARPFIAFNAHRVYTHEMLRDFCTGLICEEEKFYSQRIGDFCSSEKVAIEPKAWDIYCGCWKKE